MSVLIGLACAICCAVFSGSVVSNPLWPHGLQPTRLLCPRGFSRQEYWSGLPCPPPTGILPTQVSSIAGRFFTDWATMKAQECWSGEPIPSPGNLPYPGIQVGSPALQADSLPTELWGKSFIINHFIINVKQWKLRLGQWLLGKLSFLKNEKNHFNLCYC